MASSQFKDDKSVLPQHVGPSYSPTRDPHDIVNVQGGDLLDLESVDPVLNAKMKLVNDTIDEIGFTPYQAKLFVLNGFGYVIHGYFRCEGQCDSMAGGMESASHATSSPALDKLRDPSCLVISSYSRRRCLAQH